MIDTTSPSSAELALTADQIAKASRHLSVTRDVLVESVTGLSALQWSFRPTDDSWSIADNLEHLVLIEGRVHAIIGNMSSAPEAESGGKQTEMDEFILNELPKRSTKVKAPEPVCPEGRWSGVEALQCFITSRDRTMQLLAAPLLRGRVRPHPLFGPWDGYQWLLAVGSHTARHTEQIREIKADVNFPGSPSH
jgi:DinB superfamily